MWPACFKTDTEAVIPLGLGYVSRLHMDNPRAHFSEQSHFSFKLGPHFLTLLQAGNLISILLQQAPQFQGHTRPQHYLSLDFHCRNTTLRNPTACSQLPEPLPFKSSPKPLQESRTLITHSHLASLSFLFNLNDPKVKCFKPNSNILISSLDYCSAMSARMAPNSWRVYQVCASGSALRLPGVKESKHTAMQVDDALHWGSACKPLY